ncbi:kynurenine 3-monooxygenase-like [Rhopilema esculentum]|uniref:kynurenine 3-monooxygenase-like n=1 Tax=Rhopilema esculentum TaxID=499914 RepID=UPI0031DB77D0
MENENKGTVIIAGAGLVGSLDALYFAQYGFDVHVYESRPDPRKEEIVAGRSINLALSKRGIEALKKVGVDVAVTSKGIPMYARMIHSHSGEKTPIPYGKKTQHILSVDRRKLNELLIDEAENNPNVHYHFEHKIIAADLESSTLTFSDVNAQKKQQTGNLIIGCDGAFSTIRKTLMRNTRMDFSQTYIPHGYKEIQMLPNKNGEYVMEPGYLHIWPRNTFMMIALPNQDKTFTCTLFMPYEIFDGIKTADDVLAFFEREFPDAIPLIGREKLAEDYLKNPVGDLISVKCKPYHFKDKLVIKGDAAHAMVPFYGQGMNSGFEDCLVFSNIFEDSNFDIGKTLEKYSITRNPDAEAICDLAMYNYIEMREHVNSKLFILRKYLDNFLYYLFPSRWIPLYTMVTFSTIPYHEVIERRKKQDKVLSKAILSLLTFGGLGVLSIAYFKPRLTSFNFQLPSINLPKMSLFVSN